MGYRKKKGYDDLYAETPLVFGAEPDPILAPHCHLLDRSLPVLDLGAGQGRHSLYMASQGFRVHAVEPSAVAAEQLARHAQEECLEIEIMVQGFKAVTETGYGGVMVFGLIPDLRWEAIDLLCGRIRSWSAPGGLVWLTGFTADDPAIEQFQDDWRVIGENSFTGPEGRVRTYLAQGQVLKLFPGYEVLHHWEGLGPEHRHGNGKPERHARFEAVLKRS